MKTTLTLLLLCYTGLFASEVNSQMARVNISAKNVKLQVVLEEIERQTDYLFLFSPEEINMGKRTSVDANNEPVAQVLASLFRNTDVSYAMEGYSIFLLKGNEIRTGKTGLTQAGKITVKGVVLDESGVPVIGANVVEKGTTNGIISDMDGAFILNTDPNATLQVSYLGYRALEVAVNNRQQITITLTEDTKALDEVVVIGYGSRAKKDLTGAVSHINSEEITRQVNISPQFAMQGKMAGILISNPGSSPVSRPEVRIRGVSTLGYNDPLYVIDGIPLTEGDASNTSAGAADFRGSVNVFTMINPNDIESISVLKDASATAIYGVRASNGVILITTKRGTEGKPRVDLSVNYGIQNIFKRYDVASMQETLDMSMEAMNANTAYTKDYWYPVYDKTSAYYAGNSKDYSKEWMDALLHENAAIQDYNISISGGLKSSTYAVGAGYSNQDDVIFKDGFTRYSLFMNSDHKLTNWLKLGESYRFIYTNFDDHISPNFRDISLILPWQPLYDPSGPDGLAVPGRDIDGTFRGYGYGPATQNNFLGTDAHTVNQRKMIRNLGTVYAEISPLQGLRFRGTFSFDYYTNKLDTYTEIENGLYSVARGTVLTEGNTFQIRERENINIVKEFLAAYANKFGKHSVDLILNAMHQDIKFNSLQASIDRNSPIPSWDQAYINEGWAAEDKGLFYNRNASGLLGYMGRLSYHYDSKYYFDATIRRDGSSKFGPGYKWGTFPSFAGAWRISSEKFMQNISWINDLKLRGGWGQSGNQETRDYAFLSIVNFNPKAAFGADPAFVGDGTIYPAAVLGDFPVVDMSWETVSTFSVGFDLIALHNKLNFTAEYYNRKTGGILQGIVIPWTIGALNSPVVNLAKVDNRGIELQAGYNDRFGDIGFNASANFTTVRNRVSNLYRDQPQESGNTRIESGYTMNYLYGYKTEGIFQTDAEVAAYKEKTEDTGYDSQKSPGDVRYVDLYGAPTETDREGALKHYEPDGRVNSYDKTYLGKTIPGYYYGITLGADYKNWDIVLGFRGVGDVQKEVAFGLNPMGVEQRYLASYRNRWTPENKSNTIPRLVQGDPSGNNRFSSRHVQDADFFRFQNFQIGYRFKGDWLNKTGINSLRCYVSGSNLFVISSYNDLDPENITTPTVFSIGANVSF